MINHGFVRVAAATPKLTVADCKYNTDEIIKIIDQAEKEKVSVITFPELSITAYTCGDLFFQQTLLKNAESSVVKLLKHLSRKSIICIVGLPIAIGHHIYNVAAILQKGNILGFVPKTYLPNYGEFYEKRWFTSAKELTEKTISFAGLEAPIGTDLLFETADMRFGIEICEDLWTPVPQSSLLALAGAEVIFNLSASDEVVGKHAYRKQLISQQSARCMAGYVYAGAGNCESTTDLVFSGDSMIAENGSILAQAERFSFESTLIKADLDIERLQADRLRDTSFTTAYLNEKLSCRKIQCYEFEESSAKLDRYIHPTPFIPADHDVLDAYCEEIFSIQVGGLAKRMLHTNCKTAVIGISGGLDSTLALLVIIKTFDKLNIPRENIYGITMPGFGTTDRTYINALGMMKALGISMKEIPIKDAVIQHLNDIEHDINLHDITYENAQARERTQILMDYANKVNGMVIGTGDLSELVLGWCTYNGDQMSMYGVNAGVPKTLVRTLVRWVAEKQMEADVQKILHDVVDTPVSPELLPTNADGKVVQITEDVVGPYILHDFFIYYSMRFAFSPSKIYFLAQHAFENQYSNDEILKWMKIYYRRFFNNQFKRSCMPDGPKVGSVNLSPRGDWRMPSDASYRLWLDEVESL